MDFLGACWIYKMEKMRRRGCWASGTEIDVQVHIDV